MLSPGTLRRTSAVLLGLVLALSLAEGLCRVSEVEWRLVDPLVTWSGADVSLHQFSEDPGLLYEIRPGLDVIVGNTEGFGDDTRWIQTNEMGFRDRPREAEKAPGTYRIVCIGGSNTYGAP